MNSIKKVVLGLTGYYCSGKSAVEKILSEKYDFSIIDVDKLGHKALEEKKEDIVNAFGEKILIKGKISRKALGSIVFSDNKRLKLLNSIVHPAMIKKVENQISNLNKRQICINAALLFDMGLDRRCNLVIIVKSSLLNILKRARERDGSSLFKTLRIINSQKELRRSDKMIYSANVCYISNNRDLKYLEEQVLRVLKGKIHDE